MGKNSQVTKVVAYCRYSSDSQRSESIDAQLRAIEDFCVKNGYIIVDKYIDEALTGTVDARPAFQRMIDESDSNKFQAVIVHKFDRFARNKYDSVFYKRELRRKGIRVVSVLEPMDDSPESIILESLLEGMAEYYSANLSREIRKGQTENALKGWWNGGIPPLGYRHNKETRRLEIIEEEAATVRQIFEMFANGYEFLEICNRLNAQGAKTKRGHKFKLTSLYCILSNEQYLGKMYYRKTKKSWGLGKREQINNEDIIVFDMPENRIISDELWDEVQAKLASKNTKPSGRPKVKYLLRGLIKCGSCGSNFCGSGRQKKKTQNGVKYYYVYSCSKKQNCEKKSISKVYIENQIKKLLLNHVFTKTNIVRIAKACEAYFKTLNIDEYKQSASIKQWLTRYENQKNAVIDIMLEGLISKEECKQRIAGLDNKIKEYKAKQNLIPKTKYTKEEIANQLYEIKGTIDTCDDDELAKIFNMFIDAVYIYKNGIKVTIIEYPFFSYAPSGSERNFNDFSLEQQNLQQQSGGNLGGGKAFSVLPLQPQTIVTYHLKKNNRYWHRI
jgi:site-specific DNA recombinase